MASVDEIETAAKSLIAVPGYFKRFLTECGEMTSEHLAIWKDRNSHAKTPAVYLDAAHEAVIELTNLASLLIRIRDHMASAIQEYESATRPSKELRPNAPNPGYLIDKMERRGWHPGDYDIFRPGWEPPSADTTT